MRVAQHAAVNDAVSLAGTVGSNSATGFVNGVLRTITKVASEEWRERVLSGTKTPDERLAVEYSHPEWVLRAFRQSLDSEGQGRTSLRAFSPPTTPHPGSASPRFPASQRRRVGRLRAYADQAVGRLFDHPRLFVAFTRHGALGHTPLERWAHALVRRVGWGRLIWGSEWPVALWRDETYRSTLDWPLRFGPDESGLQAFRHGNAQRLFFARASDARPLAPEWDLMALRRRADVWLFPPSLDVSEQRHRGLMQAYERWGGEERGRYSEFVLAMAERGAGLA